MPWRAPHMTYNQEKYGIRGTAGNYWITNNLLNQIIILVFYHIISCSGQALESIPNFIIDTIVVREHLFLL